MSTPPLWQLPRSIYSYPRIAFNVEHIHIIKDRCGLTPSYQTEVGLVYLGGGVAGSRCRGLLPRHWGQKPGAGCDIKNEQVIEELVEVASSEDVENVGIQKVDHGMAGSWGRDCDWSLFIVKDLVPDLICKVEEVHVIEKICEVGTSHYPHLLACRVSLLNYFKRNSWAGTWLKFLSFIREHQYFHFEMTGIAYNLLKEKNCSTWIAWRIRKVNIWKVVKE